MVTEPFLLEPVLKAKPWGGRNLTRLFGRGLAPGEKIGESWELCARPGDSNIIASGPLSGKTLLDVIQADPEAMLGGQISAATGARLPLLAKFVDASERLSVQVHPDDCMAGALGETDSGKEEAWLVLDARPGAALILGTAREITFGQLVRMCEEGDYECLNFVEVVPGDIVAIPPGTLHAIGEGLVLFEVSQNSDLTYRVHDWNRALKGRPLHKDKARKVLTCGPPVGVKQHLPRTAPLTELYTGKHLRLLELAPGPQPFTLEEDTFFSLTVLEGSLKIESGGTVLEPGAGQTVFAPAATSPIRVSGTARAALLTSTRDN